MKVCLIKENANLMSCVYKWLMADEAHSNSTRFGNLTPAIQAQRVRRRVRVASPGGQDVSTLDEVVQSLNLNAADGSVETFCRDELWKTFDP